MQKLERGPRTALVSLLCIGSATVAACGGIVGAEGLPDANDGTRGSANDAGGSAGGGSSGGSPGQPVTSGDDDSGSTVSPVLDGSSGDDDDLDAGVFPDATIDIDAGTGSGAGTLEAGSPSVVTAVQRPVVALVSDGTNVFWSDGQNVFSVPATGGTSSTLTTTGSASLALDQTYVYFVDPAGVERAPKAGGPPTRLVSTTQATAVALLDQTVFWVEATGQMSTSPRVSLRSATTSGTGAQTIATLTLATSPSSLMVAGTTAYLSGSVFAMVDLARARPIPAPTLHCLAIATDGTNGYCSDTGNGQIHRITPAGVDSVIATNQAEPWGLACDGTNLFWSNDSAMGNVSGLTLPHGPTLTLISETSPAIVAVDAARIYWTVAGAIKSATK